MKTRLFALVAALPLLGSTAISCVADSTHQGELGDGNAQIRLMSTSVDLASMDVCWVQQDGTTTLISTDAELLDSVSTRFLELPLDSLAAVRLAHPGTGCDASSVLDLWLHREDDDMSADKHRILVVEGSLEDPATLAGHLLVEDTERSPESVEFRSGCRVGAYAVHRVETVVDNVCTTRATLSVCETRFYSDGEGGVYGVNSWNDIYDSGNVDCSVDPCIEP